MRERAQGRRDRDQKFALRDLAASSGIHGVGVGRLHGHHRGLPELLEWLRQRGGSYASGVRVGKIWASVASSPAKAFGPTLAAVVPVDLHIRAPSRESLRNIREDDRLAIDLLNKMHRLASVKLGEVDSQFARKLYDAVPGRTPRSRCWATATAAHFAGGNAHAWNGDTATCVAAFPPPGLALGKSAPSNGYGLFNLLTFEMYRTCYATIRSRAAYLDEETEGARQAIVPVGDLFAARVHRAERRRRLRRGGARLRVHRHPTDRRRRRAPRLVRRPRQRHAPQALRLRAARPNPHDGVAVTLDDVPATNLATGAAARAWLAEQGFDSGRALTHDGPSFELLAALRLRHATDDEYRNGAAFAIAEGEAVSDANEARVWRAVGDLARALARPPTRPRTTAGGSTRCARSQIFWRADFRAGGGARAAGARVPRRARRAGRGERGARRAAARGASARGRGRCERRRTEHH